jgi:hypothetical protein
MIQRMVVFSPSFLVFFFDFLPSEWEYDPNRLSDPQAPLLTSIGGSGYLTEMMMTTRFYFPVSTMSDNPPLLAKYSKGGRKSKKKLGVRQQVIHLHFSPFVPPFGQSLSIKTHSYLPLVDELGLETSDLKTVLHHNISQSEPDSPPVSIWNWMILLPYQLRAFHRMGLSPASIQSPDDTSEDNRADDASAPLNGIETKETYRANTLPIIFLPTIIPIPKSLTWIKLRDNFRVDDQTVLRYIPYFGDDDFGFDMSAYEFVPWELEGDIGGEVIETTISTIMRKYELSFEQEANQILIDLEINGDEQNRRQQGSSLETTLMKLFSLSLAQLRQAKKHGDMYFDLILSGNKIEIPPQLEKRLIHRFGTRSLLPLLLRTAQDSQSHQLKELVLDSYGYRNKSDYKSVAENYVDMFCRRCYKYDCRTHGIEQPKQRFHEDPLDILVVNENGAIITETLYKKRIKRKKNQLLNESAIESAGVVNDNKGSDENEEQERGEEAKEMESDLNNLDYYLASDGTRIPYGLYQKSGSDVQTSSISKKRKVSTQPPTPECAVASRLRDMILLSDPSYLEQIQQKSSQTELPLAMTSKIAFLLGTCKPQDVSEMCFGEVGSTNAATVTSKELKKKKRLQPKDTKPVNNSNPSAELLRTGPGKEENERIPTGPLFNLGAALTNIRKDGFSLVHQPCDHEGPCVLGICECVDSTGYCETDCACSSACKNRFQGCKCAPGQCRTLLYVSIFIVVRSHSFPSLALCDSL